MYYAGIFGLIDCPQIDMEIKHVFLPSGSVTKTNLAGTRCRAGAGRLDDKVCACLLPTSCPQNPGSVERLMAASSPPTWTIPAGISSCFASSHRFQLQFYPLQRNSELNGGGAVGNELEEWRIGH